MEFGLLGPLLITRDGQIVEVGAPKQRALLLLLLLRVGETVPLDRLIDGLWGDDPPPQARITLRSYLSNLRRVLDEPGSNSVIVTRGAGYGLQIDPEAVDAVRFERLVTAAREVLLADPRAALVSLDEALGLWRGQALADLADGVAARGERVRLEEMRLAAQEDRFEALLALGRHGDAVPALEAFTAAEPLRERARGQLMVGLYRSGRAPDALASFQQFRATLAEELGLDPSPQLQQLNDRILRQASDLDLPPAPVATSAGHPGQADAASPAAAPEVPGAITHGRLVGRTHERATLQTALDRLAAGKGGLVLIAGEPGIGKTALLSELSRLAAAAGMEVAWGRCQETAAAPAFWPWVQILRQVAARRSDAEIRTLTGGPAAAVAQLVDDIALRVGDHKPVPGTDPEAGRFQLYDAIATFLLRAAGQGPVVLLLDDLHWGDPPSLQTLAFLAPLVEPGRLLIAGTYRDVRADWAAELEATLATVAREPSTQQLTLAGLQPAAVTELASELRRSPVPDEEAALLHQRTGGNPFFVRQLAHLAHETGGQAAEPQIPAGVRHVIARRLSLLPDDTGQLLEAAAVLGGEFALRRLAAITGAAPDAVIEALGDAAIHGLVEALGQPATSFRFVHALVRETIYDGLQPHRVARLHAQTAHALEELSRAPAAELAEHCWLAGDLVDADRSVRWLTAAAAEALEVLAYEQAEASLRRALDRVTDPAVELDIRVRLVELLISLHGWAAEVVEEAAAPVRDLGHQTHMGPAVVSLWLALFTVATARGDFGAAGDVAAQLLALAEEADDPGALAAAHAIVAYVDLTLGRNLEGAHAHALEAEHWAKLAPPEALEAAPQHLGVSAIYMQGYALASLGQASAAIEEARRSIALADDLASPLAQVIARMFGGLVGVLSQQPTFAAEIADRGLDLCQRYGFAFARALLTVTDGWARARVGGEPVQQATRMAEAIEEIRRFEHADPLAKCLLYTAETFLLADDPAAAAGYLHEALALSAQTGEFLLPERVRAAEEALADHAQAQQR